MRIDNSILYSVYRVPGLVSAHIKTQMSKQINERMNAYLSCKSGCEDRQVQRLKLWVLCLGIRLCFHLGGYLCHY